MPFSPTPIESSKLANAPLPSRVRHILTHLFSDLRTALVQQTPALLQEAELALARATTNGDQQLESQRVAAMRNLANGEKTFTQAFLGYIETALAELKTTQPKNNSETVAPTTFTLALLDDEEADDSTLLDSMAARIGAHNGLDLHLLSHRFGVLAASPAFENELLPLGPHAFCRAVADAADQLKLVGYARVQLFHSFEKTFVALYPSLLEAFNQRLVALGVLPHLSFVPMRSRPATHFDTDSNATLPAQTTPRAAEPPQAAVPSAFFDLVETRNTTPAQPILAPALHDFAELQTLLKERRQLLSRLRPETAENRAPETLPHDEVQSFLQRMRSASGKADSLADIRQNLLAQARQAHGHGVALNELDNDSFDLMQLLMSQLQQHQRKSSTGEALLDNLRLPFLQLALRDNAFFTEAQHPARQLLDAFSDAGAPWVAEDDFDTQWLGLLQRAASSIIHDTTGSPDVFAEANQTLQSGLATLERKAEMAEKRQIEAARGREKLALARLRATEEINHALNGRNLSQFHATLMQDTWADVLSLTHLRNGEDSTAWQQLLQLTQHILDAATGQAAAPSPEEQALIQQALEQVGYHTDDAASITHELISSDVSDASSSARSALLAKLQERTRLGEGSAQQSSNEQAQLSSEEQTAHAQLCALELPVWIDLHDETNSRKRRRLVWLSEKTGQVLLTNRRGLRSGDSNLTTLARQLAAGTLHIMEKSQSPAEHAWDAALESLRRLGSSQPHHEGEGA